MEKSFCDETFPGFSWCKVVGSQGLNENPSSSRGSRRTQSNLLHKFPLLSPMPRVEARSESTVQIKLHVCVWLQDDEWEINDVF